MSMLLTNETVIGGTKLDGDVMLLESDGVTINAPTRAKPWFKFNLKAALGKNGAPSENGIDWLLKPGVHLFILLQVPEGTIDRKALD